VPKQRVNKRDIVEQIQKLGVSKGDLIFLVADLTIVGYFNESKEQTYQDWTDILLEVIGPKGTLVIPAYTKSFFSWAKNKQIIFTKGTEPDAGALSYAFYKFTKFKRSAHPTNSCFAIGPMANTILDNHDHNSDTYAPYHKIIEHGGKNLMLGAFYDKRLSPMAFHAAQETLGITKKNWCSGFLQTYYLEKNKLQLFTRYGVGGCTAGGYKALGHHIIEDAIIFGKVGRGLSACVDTKKSYEIYMDLFKSNKDLVRCDNKLCPDCYGSPFYQNPIFWLRKIIEKFKENIGH